MMPSAEVSIGWGAQALLLRPASDSMSGDFPYRQSNGDLSDPGTTFLQSFGADSPKA